MSYKRCFFDIHNTFKIRYGGFFLSKKKSPLKKKKSSKGRTNKNVKGNNALIEELWSVVLKLKRTGRRKSRLARGFEIR